MCSLCYLDFHCLPRILVTHAFENTFVFTDAKINSIAPGSICVSVYLEDKLNIPHLYSYVRTNVSPEAM